MTEPEVVTDEEPGAGRRGGRRWPAVTAIAAAVVLLAGGAYGVSLVTGGTEAPGQLAIDGGAAGAGEAASEELSPVFYRAGDALPGTPEDAPVFRFDGTVDAAAVAELAEVLGVAGEPELADGYWQVGAALPDGELRLLVEESGGGQWSLSPYAAPELLPADTDPAASVEPTVEPVETVEPARPIGGLPGMPPVDLPVEAGPEPGLTDKAPREPGPHDGERGLEDAPVPQDLERTTPGAAPTEEPSEPASPDDGVSSDHDGGRGVDDAPNTPAEPVSEKEALASVAPLLTELDLPAERADTSQVDGDQRVVAVDPAVDGYATYGWSTRLAVGPDGRIVNGFGSLLTPVADDSYPLIGAEEALAELNGGTAEPSDGARVVEVTGAELGLGYESSDGEPVLAPTWLFSVDDEATFVTNPSWYRVSHLAVEPALVTGVAGSWPGGGADLGAGEPGSGPVEPGTGGDTPAHQGGAPGAPGDAMAPPPGPLTGLEPYGDGATELTYWNWTGVCGDYTAVARETEDTVTVELLHESDGNDVCVLMAVSKPFTVTLEAPIGDRTVLDEHGEELEQLSDLSRQYLEDNRDHS
ncbi:MULTISPECIES: hypothetical protein [unclassified Streptomyces]|uniref:hypothetical protein n=1 Tax=unclassified Streptomyces TaxID=2593676 RepID=UPI0011B0E3C3|nr:MULTISPECIES: hypothetical protein [unclassified Streptomyces]